MPDKHQPLPFKMIARRKEKGQHFRPNKSPAASSENFYQTLTHRIKLFQELYIAPVTVS